MQDSRTITRKSASNLALAFVLLPKAKREGMSALYAFCREVDDVADDEMLPVEERRSQLALWRADIGRACGGAPSRNDGSLPGAPLPAKAGLVFSDTQDRSLTVAALTPSGGRAGAEQSRDREGAVRTLNEYKAGSMLPHFRVNQELQPFILQHHLPYELFDELIRGVEMDLDIKRYETYADLEEYCYRVASVVGLLSIEIFGYQNPACRDYANYLGKALQLTNILRDVRTDAERGRIYLPLSELARFKVSEDEILRLQYSERFRDLAASVAGQARRFYQLAQQTLPAEDRRSMAAAELMGSVYWRLLRKLELRAFDVFGPHPTRLSKGQKLLLICRTWYRLFSGTMVPNYGVR